MKTKVAILLPGLVRTYGLTHRSLFDNLIGPNEWDADLFIHSWNITGNLKQKKSYGPDFEKDDWIDQDEIVDIPDLKNSYRPHKCFVERYDKWKVGEIDRVKDFSAIFRSDEYTRVLNSIMAQFYKLKKCYTCMENHAKTNGIKYNYVIKARCDLLFEEKTIFDQELMKIAKTNIVCPSYYLKGDRGHHYINDQFAIGSMKNMRIYCNMYDRIFEVANEMGGDFMLYPEELLAHHLISNYVSIHIHNFKSKLERGIINENTVATDSQPNCD
jgi:hypothetical protein